MNNPTRVTIQETYDLPSQGKFPGVPKTYTTRAMSLMDEKQRLASQNGLYGVVDVIGNCIVQPQGFNPYDMPQFDIDFAMIKLRTISHGPIYKVDVTCPYCGHTHKTEINLDELIVRNVPDDFKPVIDIGPLPNSGDVLEVKILTMGDIRYVEEEAKRVIAKFPDYKGDPADVLMYTTRILTVNGEKLPFTQLRSYVETMTAGDSIYFDQVYKDAIGNYGVDTNLSFTCNKCGQAFTRFMPLNAEFFRPQYNIIKRKDV